MKAWIHRNLALSMYNKPFWEKSKSPPGTEEQTWFTTKEESDAMRLFTYRTDK